MGIMPHLQEIESGADYCDFVVFTLLDLYLYYGIIVFIVKDSTLT